VPSDRIQREMLRASLEARYADTTSKPREYEEIIWVLNQLQSLAGKRNTALHLPIIFVNDLIARTENDIEIMPHYFFGNPHAKQLRGKDLIQEIRWYRDHISKLAEYAGCLHYSVAFPDYTLPDRPQLLPREHFQSRAQRRRKKDSR
jgi:hypothetical protein